MLPSAKKIKETAKEMFSANIFAYIFACLPVIFSSAVIMLVSGALHTVTNEIFALTVELLLTFFLLFPLILGTVKYFSRTVENVTDLPSYSFYYFSTLTSYKKAMKFAFCLLGGMALSGFLLSLPSLIVRFFASASFYEIIDVPIPLWLPILSTISSLLLILAFLAFLLVNLKYYLSFYLFVINDEIPSRKAIKQSLIISRRTQLDFVYLFFSMLLYILLSLLFLPLIFTLPIILIVYCIHCKCAVLQYNFTIDSLKK